MKRGTRHFLTCKSVVKRTQEDVDDSALSLFASLLHTHPHFNNSERRDNHVRFFILSRTLSSSRSLILDALTFVGILSFLNEAHALSVGQSDEKFVWHWFSRFFGSRFPGFSEDELGRTVDGIFAVFLSDRSKKRGDAKGSFVVLTTALLDNGVSRD